MPLVHLIRIFPNFRRNYKSSRYAESTKIKFGVSSLVKAQTAAGIKEEAASEIERTSWKISSSLEHISTRRRLDLSKG